MKKFSFILLSSFILFAITACSNDNGDNSNSNNNHKSENQSSNQKSTNQNSNSNSEYHSKSNEQQTNDLSDEEKVALAISDDSIANSVVTADELRNGTFDTKDGAESDEDVKNLYLEPIAENSTFVKGAPKDMMFFNVTPSKGAFITQIGFNKSKIVIFNGRNNTTYDNLFSQGKVNNINQLYKQFHNSDYKNIATKIIIGIKPGINDNKEANTNSANTEDNEKDTVTRHNVIDIVEDFEGKPLDTNKYTYKEPEMRSNGEWGFSFEDKQGNLAGSYIIDANGTVKKFDKNGAPVKH